MTEDITIGLLVDHQECIPILSKWLYDEWTPLYHLYDLNSAEDTANDLRSNYLNRDKLPITFAAFYKGELAGTVSIDKDDFKDYKNLMPWLSALFVHEKFRKKGIGHKLIQVCENMAVQLGFKDIYLGTHDKQALYEHVGWTILERNVEKSGTLWDMMTKKLLK